MDIPEPSPREAEQRAYAREVAQEILAKRDSEKRAAEERVSVRQAERKAGSAVLAGGLVVAATVAIFYSQFTASIEARNTQRQAQVQLDRLADEMADDVARRADGTAKESPAPAGPSVRDTVEEQRDDAIDEFFAPIIDKAPDVAVVLGGVLTGYAGTALVRRRARTRREDRAAEAAVLADVRKRWETAVARHDEIAKQYADIRLDPVAAIDHMALWDVTGMLTERFTLAYAKVTDARARHQTQPADERLVDAYADLVDRAHLAWTDARENARQLGVLVLPVEQLADARTARHLLVLAASDSATEEESRNAAEKASKRLAEIRGIRFPAEASKAILAPARKAITA